MIFHLASKSDILVVAATTSCLGAILAVLLQWLPQGDDLTTKPRARLVPARMCDPDDEVVLKFGRKPHKPQPGVRETSSP